MNHNNKTKVTEVEEPTSDEIESGGLFPGRNDFSLEVIATERLTEVELKTLKRVAYLLSKVGMKLKEACSMIDTPYEEFEALMAREPVVARVVKIKELQFKKDLMYTLSSRARGGNEKIALWMLERLYPEEFAEKKDADTDRNTTQDAMRLAIDFIRQSGSNAPLVAEDSGKPRKGSGDEREEAQRHISGIESILGSK